MRERVFGDTSEAGTTGIDGSHAGPILSGLKTWLETGDLLTTPGSLKYS